MTRESIEAVVRETYARFEKEPSREAIEAWVSMFQPFDLEPFKTGVARCIEALHDAGCDFPPPAPTVRLFVQGQQCTCAGLCEYDDAA